MIFASDLDRTIIYSDKFIKEFSGPIREVETGSYKSYMTAPAAELVKKIACSAVFIPCTTRTVEQYRRVEFLQKEVAPKYAITTNGANILVEGVLDAAHREKIARSLANECMAGEDMLGEFSKLSCDKWARPMRNADGVFHYCVVEREKVPLQELASFSSWAREQKWEVSLQGRKLYLVPGVINKWSALKRVAEITGEHRIIAAGDSLLDLPLIKGADFAVSPAHGELYEQFGGPQNNWMFTQSSGILAGEEILRVVSSIIAGSRLKKIL